MQQNEINKLTQTIRSFIRKGKSDLFNIPYENEQALYTLAVLLYDHKGKKANIFLNKEDFDKLYPLLNETVEWSDKTTLIVSNDVLANDKLHEAMPFETDSYFNETHPKLKDLTGKKANVRIVTLDNDKVPSFFSFDNMHILRFNESNESKAFGCCLNVWGNSKESQRHKILNNIFQDLLNKSVPYSMELVNHYQLRFDLPQIKNDHIKE